MRVVMVTAWYPTLASPTAGIFVQHDAELIATAHEVEVVHLVSPELLSPEDLAADKHRRVKVTRVPLSRTSPRGMNAMWRSLRPILERAELVHTQAFTTLIPFAGRRVNLPWVHSEHWSGVADPSSLAAGARAILRITAPLLRRPDVVTAVSGYLAERVRAHRTGPVVVVPSVVPPASLIAPPQDPHHIRLVAAGGLTEGKDPFLALATVRELHRRGMSASLTWLGDGPLRAPLQATSRAEDQLSLPGATDRTGVGVALDAADIFLLPTKGETLCLSALEAIAHGRPVVIGARGGQADYVVTGNGRLVEARTPAAYADAVMELWETAEARTPNSIAATIGDRFHAEQVLEGYDSAYRAAKRLRGARTSALKNASVNWVADHPTSIPGRIAARRFGTPAREWDARVVNAPDSAVRVLIAPANYAGQAREWAEALEAADQTISARNYAVEAGAFDFTADLVVPPAVFHNSRQWQQAQLAAARGFTHLLAESFIPPFGRLFGRDFERQIAALGTEVRLAMMCHGSDIRRPSLSRARTHLSPYALQDGAADRAEVLVERHLEIIARANVPVFVSTPDLLQDVPGGHWCPVIVDAARWAIARAEHGGPLRVVHAPSKSAAKGSASIEPTLERLADEGVIEYRQLRGIPHAEMPAVLARADIVVDQFSVGSYGVAACEAMAAGAIVVSHVTAEVRETVRTQSGLQLPIVEARPQSLEAALRGLANDAPRRAALVDEGQEFVLAVHDGRRSADVLLNHWICTDQTPRSA